MAEIARPERAIGKKLRENDPLYGERYFMATEALLKAIERGELPAIVEAQQDVLLYASIILTDALTR